MQRIGAKDPLRPTPARPARPARPTRTTRALTLSLGLALTLPAAPACLGPLDILGNREQVTEDEDLTKDPRIEDDRIEDKHPTYDATRTVTETFDGCRVTLNKSATVTKLDVLTFDSAADKALEGRLFAGRGAALQALASVGGADVLPSMEVVNGFMKPFNDGLYAAIELGLQQGVPGVVQSKQQLLSSLLAGLKTLHGGATAAQQQHLEHAMIFVGAALILGGGSAADLPAPLLAKAQQEATAFETTDPFNARPVGFYTWNATLQQVFKQDRYLQNQGELGFVSSAEGELGLFAALAVALEQDAALTGQYQQLLSLYAGLTNPLASHTPLTLFPLVDGLSSLDDLPALRASLNAAAKLPYVCTGAELALLPASRGKETDFFKQTYCGDPPDAQVDFMNVLINAVRKGLLDLSPDNSSGWYDYQLHALETLLLPERGPESDHLLLTAAYKKKLIETFKSILTQNRETHVKQLERGVDAVSLPPREVEVYPQLPVEPFPTFYLRTARAYRFLGTYLQGVLGSAFLSGQQRLLESGKRGALSLQQELQRMTELLYGLHALTSRAVGLDEQAALLQDELAELDQAACVKRAQSWLAGWRTDTDILADPRVIVPIWRSTTTKSFVYWAILGVKVIKIGAEFVAGHEPKVVSTDGSCTVKGLVGRSYYLLMEQMEQVRTPETAPPPTRDEFRKLCDKHKTADAIVKALAGLGSGT